MKTLLCCVLFFVIPTAYAGFEQVNLGARPAALGKTFVGIADGPWTVFYNPAGLVACASVEFSCYYSPSPFGLTPLSLSGAVAVFPTGFGTFAAAGRIFGFSLYRECSGTLSSAWQLQGVDIGLNLNYHSVSIRGYGSAGTIGIDAGILTQITESVRCGAILRNINSPAIGSAGETLPQSFAAGVGWRPADMLLIGVDIVSESPFDAATRFGCEWSLLNAVDLRVGWCDSPNEYCAGFGLHLPVVSFDYAFSLHEELGSTHEFTLTIR
jgi:hypothetical protein